MQLSYLPRLPGKSVFGLADLAECRPGRVVSLTLYRNGGDSIVVFAFDAGEGVSQEVLDEDCLYWLLEGEAIVTAGGVRHSLNGGGCFIVPARVPHSVDMIARSKVMVISVGCGF